MHFIDGFNISINVQSDHGPTVVRLVQKLINLKLLNSLHLYE